MIYLRICILKNNNISDACYIENRILFSDANKINQYKVYYKSHAPSESNIQKEIHYHFKKNSRDFIIVYQIIATYVYKTVEYNIYWIISCILNLECSNHITQYKFGTTQYKFGTTQWYEYASSNHVSYGNLYNRI